MASFTIDPDNRLIILDQIAPVSNVVTLAVKENLYSEMKLFWKDNALAKGLIFPWKAVGGFDYGGGRKQGTDYFLRNDLGWRIRPYEADHELQIIGNLRPYNTAYATIIPTVGDYVVYAPQERSAVVQVVEVGGSALTTEEHDKLMAVPGAADNADAVWDEATTSHESFGSFGEMIKYILKKAKQAANKL